MTSDEARRKIKQHIVRRGNEYVHLTPHFVLYWWRICNKALFGGKLALPKNIIIKNFKDDVYGYCESGTSNPSVVLGIQAGIDSRRCFMTVLVHEMVHQWQHQEHGRMSHGKTFYAWESRVKRYLGLNLNEYITDEDE